MSNRTAFIVLVISLAILWGLWLWPHKSNRRIEYNDGDHHIALSQWSGYCGRSRADVKHTVDSAASLIPTTPIRTTVPNLVSQPVPSSITGPDSPRAPEESHIYKIVNTRLILIKTESDGDYHMVLRSTIDPSKTMIVESIPPSCAQGSPFLSQITAVRNTVDQWSTQPLPRTVTITGVGYFDFIHGQTGVAPNGIELHPVLSLQ